MISQGPIVKGIGGGIRVLGWRGMLNHWLDRLFRLLGVDFLRFRLMRTRYRHLPTTRTLLKVLC
jgi:hypothetical protein